MYPWRVEDHEINGAALSLMKSEHVNAMRQGQHSSFSGTQRRENVDENADTPSIEDVEGEKRQEEGRTTSNADRVLHHFVPLDRVFSILQHRQRADADARQQRREREDGGVRLSNLRKWTLLPSDREAVRQYYPAPPSDAMMERAFGFTSGVGGTSTSSRLSESAHRHGEKRQRSSGVDGAKSRGRSTSPHETPTALSFIQEPSMRFADGFQTVDYMGRLFIHPLPSALQAAAVRQAEPCVPPRAPKRVLQAPLVRRGTTGPAAGSSSSSSGAPTSSQGAATGVQLLRWAPPSFGHLLFSADLQGVAKLWRCQSSGAPAAPRPSAAGHSACIATFRAHTRPIKSLRVTSDASILTTGSTDGTITMWDVETGKCLHQLWCNEPALYTELSQSVGEQAGRRAGAVLPVVDHLHHPSDERHILLAAVDRKVLLYDVRTPSHKLSSGATAADGGETGGFGGCVAFKPQREYMGHMGTILHLSLLGSSGSKMLTTSEDKTLRTWDYAIPIQIKQFADAGMHAISHVIPHPYESDLLAAQSLNNKVIVFQDEGGGRLRLWQHREFTGHKIAGTGCQLGFSRDGTMLSSGDIHGRLFLWKWSNGELVKKFSAHSEMLTTHVWHPIDPSRIVTAGWDGAIKEWM